MEMEKQQEYEDRLQAIEQLLEKVNKNLKKIKNKISLTQKNKQNEQLR